MQTWMYVIGGLILLFGTSFNFTESHDEDEWDACEMNKEGMNYKE